MNSTPAASNPQQILQRTLADWETLLPEDLSKLLKMVATFFEIPFGEHGIRPPMLGMFNGQSPRFSDKQDMTSKEFIRQKQPKTDVDKVACLAYYLTHYRSQPQFKTLDITQLNTEAAQSKFANSSVSVNNASLGGFLVPAGSGAKQLSAWAEQYVEALPDRERARAVQTDHRRRGRRGTKPSKLAEGA